MSDDPQVPDFVPSLEIELAIYINAAAMSVLKRWGMFPDISEEVPSTGLLQASDQAAQQIAAWARSSRED